MTLPGPSPRRVDLLVDFATSPRFDREFSAAIARAFPGGVVTDESVFSMALDHFLLQHKLPCGLPLRPWR